MSLGELEALITQQEKLASAANPEQESPDRAEVLDVRRREKPIQEHGRSDSDWNKYEDLLRVPALG